MNELDRQLEELLSEPIASVLNREKFTFDELAAPFGKSLVLFGAGELGRRTLAGMRQLDIEPLAFSDNNPRLWRKSIDGLQVLPPAEAVQKYGSTAVFVLTIWSDTIGHPLDSIEKQLNGYGPTKVVSFGFLYWKYAEAFLPYFGLDLPHKTRAQIDQVRAASFLWADDASRTEYLAQLRWRLQLDFAGLPSPKLEAQYFPDGLFSFIPEEVFVDCGAFDGDTIRLFLEHKGSSFNRLIAVEPDPINFSKLTSYVASLPDHLKQKITVHQTATGISRGKVTFAAKGTIQSNITETGNLEVDCLPLDDLLYSITPTYVKMDIEGAELETLRGARRIIKEFRPILSFSVYHRFDHIWHLPLLIQSISSNYSFFLRPHGQTCWELVCYAIPKNRLNAV
ncbi:MAG: FkbM family methyltransferase [Chloroflexi bacterium]|nr:FkbM family methyltransferase [Chloroflexota bacterium]